ncbi:MAG: hypothetical protein A3H97_05755 [Acidobacteria bacterium RIFCSPLOWO2_02_FULL_65_29]|nr:MAG: hypothetical protein A3H97_05755 [Acidobacteria bacterium RIFCSPLOWO2_02_FULL_65_29]
MVELGDRPRLSVEALTELRVRRQMRRQNLDGDEPIEPRVPRLVDLSHPPGAGQRQDLERAEPESL